PVPPNTPATVAGAARPVGAGTHHFEARAGTATVERSRGLTEPTTATDGQESGRGATRRFAVASRTASSHRGGRGWAWPVAAVAGLLLALALSMRRVVRRSR